MMYDRIPDFSQVLDFYRFMLGHSNPHSQNFLAFHTALDSQPSLLN